MEYADTENAIGGYSFLLPEYKRFITGAFWLTTFRLDNQLSVTGGIRYDRGRIDITAFEDPYLVEYLHRQGYEEEVIQAYRWRSYPVDRAYGNYSCSAGVVWTPAAGHLLKMNVGRSFRLPGGNELASNGVHHGTFRHEKGDVTLSSEQGWQIDASYTLAYKKWNWLFHLLPVGLIIIFICVLRENGLYCPMPDRFINIVAHVLCSWVVR